MIFQSLKRIIFRTIRLSFSSAMFLRFAYSLHLTATMHWAVDLAIMTKALDVNMTKRQMTNSGVN